VKLLVVLASPPASSSGARTLRRLEFLSEVLVGAELTTTNLCSTPSSDIPALSEVAATAEPWLSSRDDLSGHLGRCDEFLAAWGLPTLTGPARLHRREQIAWLETEARRAGHLTAWTVAGQARHPSRWHQYVSDKHGRTSGGTFADRLREVLLQSPLEMLRET
jgi:hypothetical protein